MYTNKKKAIILTFAWALQIVAFLLVSETSTYSFLSILSILQLIYNIWSVSACSNEKIFSLASIFLIFSWFFHCAQIVKLGCNILGTVPLDVTKYVHHGDIIQAFKFYYLTQMLIAVSMIFYSAKNNSRSKENSSNDMFDVRKSATALISVGIIPRLYIDISILVNGFSNGYAGVYSLIIPQPIQTISFFFDAGCIVLLMDKSKKHNILFWVILIYKCISMFTGARQEQIAFLVIWIFLYYFIVNKINPKSIAMLILIVFTGSLIVNAIGNVRTSKSISFEAIFNNMTLTSENSIIGNMMGEFGSSLTTLAVTISQVPSRVNYGYGDAYLAGIVSVIPKMTNIVGLSDSTLYVRKLSGTAYFGGSYMGELYYNFSWLGIFGGLILGRVVMLVQNGVYKCKYEKLTLNSVMAAITMISLILFVRGYFTDMIQRLVWVWIFLKICSKTTNRKYSSK